MPRTVLHVDLDAFYASVEQRDDPSLVGRPVVVGGHDQRGVVLAASYEVRKFGVKSAMPMATARRLCPRMVVVRPRMHHYADVSQAFFEILGKFSPMVEGLSLDEAFLDVTGEERLLGDGPMIGRAIKDRVRNELRLVASVGVASCKLIAKIASDLKKPDGLMVVPAGEEEGFMAPLPVGRMWGIGEVTEQALKSIGIVTIGDAMRAGEAALATRLGVEGARRFLALARGDDARAVDPGRQNVSMGSEDTFDRDVYDRETLARELLAQADRSCARARAHGERARTVAIKVKYANHELISRRVTLERPTADGRVVGKAAVELLGAVPAIERRGVRLTGVTLSGFCDRDAPRQLDFDEAAAERGEKLGETLDEIKKKFGGGAVKRAVHVPAADDE